MEAQACNIFLGIRITQSTKGSPRKVDHPGFLSKVLKYARLSKHIIKSQMAQYSEHLPDSS